MSVQQWTVHRVECDEPGCERVGPESRESLIDARMRAWDEGWQRWATLQSGVPTYATYENFCPDHRRPVRVVRRQ